MGLVAQPERQSIFLGEMMERLGIDPAGGVVPRLSLTYLTAFHRCHSCPSKQTCRAWLDSTCIGDVRPALLPECRHFL